MKEEINRNIYISRLLVLSALTMVGVTGCSRHKVHQHDAVPMGCEDDYCYRGEGKMHDPWEGVNRATFRFNKKLDKAIFAPVDRIYTTFVPARGRTMLHSALQNLAEPLNLINALAQLDPKKISNTVGRFLLNSTWGILGLYDIASQAGMKYDAQSLGRSTFHRYGIKRGSYLVLPFLGPSTVRDAIGIGGDLVIDPVSRVKIKNWNLIRNSSLLIDKKSEGLEIMKQVEVVALDEYATMRNLYGQKYE